MKLPFPKTKSYREKQAFCREIERLYMLRSTRPNLSNEERAYYVREATKYVKLTTSPWLYFRTESGLRRVREGLSPREPVYYHGVGI